jgi:alpha-amylase
MKSLLNTLFASLVASGVLAPATPAYAQTAVKPAAAVDVSPVAAQRKALPLPAHWQRGAFMEIFVRAYQDSNGDGIGDLRGLISRLDYLQDLGIKGLWLMPIQANADGDHGYATTDFRAIAPEYGTLQDFDDLIREAHKRGIGIIVDYVLNHSSAEHPLFVDARNNPKSPWRDWFVFRDTLPADAADWDIWGAFPWYPTATEPWTFQGELKTMPRPAADAKDLYFGTFGPHMPDFNMRNPAVVDYHMSSLRFWLNRGLAGFRLDAVPHLIENSGKDWNDQPQSRALTKQFVDLIRGYPGRHVVCEATAKPIDYGRTDLCGGAFAFGYVHHFGKAAMGEAESVKQLASYFTQHGASMATFVSNHDMFAGKRLWDQVGGDEARYKLAAAGYLLQPGTPFIYYGEEIGQAGVNTMRGDLPLRSPMSWSHDPGTAGFTTGVPFRPLAPNATSHNVDAQRADPESIHAFYKAMIGLRNSRPSISRGSFERSFAQGLLLGFERRLGAEKTLVLINYGTTDAKVDLQVRGARSVYPADPKRRGIGPAHTVPPQSVQVLALP